MEFSQETRAAWAEYERETNKLKQRISELETENARLREEIKAKESYITFLEDGEDE